MSLTPVETRAPPTPGKLVYRLVLPEQTPSNNVIKGMHFHTYRALRKRWRTMVLAALRGLRPASSIRNAGLTVVRHCASSGLDWDNAYGGLKPLLDCLVEPSARNPDGLGLIADDNPRNMPVAPYMQQVVSSRGEGRTEVLIYDVEGGASTPGWQEGGNLTYHLWLPEETPSNNVIKGLHFHAYRAFRNKWRDRVYCALQGSGIKETVAVSRLEIVRHCVGHLDWDNALGGLKPFLDCLVAPSARNPDGLGLVADDNPHNMPQPPFMRQVKAKRGEGRTELLVYAM
ncbi:hypothetical protein F6X40_17395 [Paraburkholderia sp. UCT31]|uniref:hypothetical protein n=1 Tax=Paraburkholderia sp. UCT31 TaxID=2615209 RepID=UPI001654D627|nr:hypothetical protein [Paraburkholderia sp. UCT31]MBC8738537.1 hypothetical protein [Paraburkholderia sp. UCT31]